MAGLLLMTPFGASAFPNFVVSKQPLGAALAGRAGQCRRGRADPLRHPMARQTAAQTAALALPPRTSQPLLSRLHMALSIDVAAAQPLPGLATKDVTSRDPVSAPPDMPVTALARLFRPRGFKSLPISDAVGAYLGLLDQSALLALPIMRPDLIARLAARLRDG